jgi:hypothetical protein
MQTNLSMTNLWAKIQTILDAKQEGYLFHHGVVVDLVEISKHKIIF